MQCTDLITVSYPDSDLWAKLGGLKYKILDNKVMKTMSAEGDGEGEKKRR